MGALVAGVDSSTQSCKVVVVDSATGQVLREGRAAHPDGTEVDPAAWWDALGAALAAAGGLQDVEAVSIAGQQHGLVALDIDGRVIRKALLWNDTRSAPAAAALVDELGAGEWVDRTGSVPVASFTATKLRWLRDAEPENAARIAAVALPHDWLSWRLRGYGPADESVLGPVLDALATDASDASGTSYWNPTLKNYDADLFLRALGRPLREAGTEGVEAGAPDPAAAVIVPAVVGHADAMGSLEKDVPLPGGSVAPAGLRIGAGAGDNAGAALGLGLTPGDVAVSLGTSGTVFGVTDQPVSDSTGTVAAFSDASGARLPIVTTLNAARVLQVTGDLLGIGHAELADEALQAPAGAGGLVLLPYFVGERTPNRPDATASLHGLTPLTMTRPYLSRAAIEGMLCSLADGVAAVEALGVSVERLLLIGGAAQNAAVRESAAQVFGRDIDLPDSGEYVARGAAVQAAWMLTGSRPDWKLAGTRVEADPHPEILERYRLLAAADTKSDAQAADAEAEDAAAPSDAAAMTA